METHLIYLLKLNLALVVCCLLYRFLLSNDTFFRFRRNFLLFSIFFSFISPLLWLPSVTETVQQNFATINLPEVFIGGEIVLEATDQKSSFPPLRTILYWVYGLGLLFFFLLFLVKLISAIKIIVRGKKQIYKGVKIILPKAGEGPFSFFRFIVIDLNAFDEEELDEIIIHEKEHVRALHSCDIILAELTKLVCWFNPFAWQLRRAVECNNEHLADQKVLQSHIDKKIYQYNLINISQAATAESLTNCYTVKHLKKRIIMMNKKQTRRSALLKYLFSGLLALFIMLGINAATDTNIFDTKEANQEQLTKNKIDENALITAVDLEQNNENEQAVSQSIDKMPQFQGGENALFKFLAKNFKYPIIAQENGIEGQVICQFIVKTDGSISNIKIVNGVDSILDNEVVRIVKLMPKWIPGEDKGKKIDVEYRFPAVNFKFQNNKKTQKVQSSDEITVVGYAKKAVVDDDKVVFQVVEKMPEFPGGQKAMFEYLSKNLVYPPLAVEKNIEGRVICQFVVKADGSIDKIEITRSIDPILDEEAIRVIESMPNWTAGENKGKPVNVKYTMPINFKLPKEPELKAGETKP